MPSGLIVFTPLNEASSWSMTFRLFSSVSRRLSTALWRPAIAPSAAACRRTETVVVICPWTFVMIWTSGRGAIAQPIRNPVMP